MIKFAIRKQNKKKQNIENDKQEFKRCPAH